MNENDTSEQACIDWADSKNFSSGDGYWFWEDKIMETWREAVRRFEESANEVYRSNDIKWMNIVSKLRNEMEERERKAFEAGYLTGYTNHRIRGESSSGEMDESYRAFKEAQNK